MRTICTILFLLALSYISPAQLTDIDSLKIVASTSEHDSSKIKNYFLIGEAYKNYIPDSAIYYFNKALQITDKSAEKITYQWYKWNIYKGMGLAYTLKGEYKKGIDAYQKQIAVALLSNDYDGIVRGYNNIGVVYQNIGNHSEAFAFYIKALRIAERNSDNWILGLVNNNIGVIYMLQNDFQKCVEYFNDALKYYSYTNDSIKMASSYSNLGCAYTRLGKRDTALYYINLSNHLFRNTNNVNELSINAVNEAIIYLEQKNYKKSLQYNDLAFNYQKLLGNTTTLANILSNKSLTYIAMYENGDKKEEYLNEAIKLGKLAYSISDSIHVPTAKSQALISIYKVDSIRGNYKNAFFEMNEMVYLMNAMLNTSSIDQMENRYLMEKKQKEIDLLEAQSQIEAERSKRMQLVLLVSIVGVALLGFLIVIIVHKLKLTQQQKQTIQQQKDTVESQNVQLNEKNEEITAQKEEIEKHRRSMIDSITYAKRIQQAVLPKFPKTASNIDHFVLFMPKDIVSGDFYWFNKIGDKLIFTVADCTGHGVPGGFMSMLGVSFLNEIVNGKELLTASQILDNLRDLIISALQQQGKRNEANDGMDISLCILDTTTNQLQFSGAFNPLFIVPADGSELQIVKGDRQPIAYFNKMRPFTNHQLQLNKGDCIYLSSDGYTDQFNLEGNKFGTKRLGKLFCSISNNIMPQQRVELEHELRNWQQDIDQIDDITIMGIRV